MENGTKLRILYLYQHLVQHTDAEHTLSTAELMKILKEDYSVKVSRNTITDDLAMLHDCGLHIEHYESTQNKYYYDGHIYELPELKVLVDAISSSKFITQRKSDELIAKLLTLTNSQNAAKLRRHIYVAGRAKSDNENGYYIVDAINDATVAEHGVQLADVGLGDAGGSSIDDIADTGEVVIRLNQIVHLDGLKAHGNLAFFVDFLHLCEQEPVAGQTVGAVAEVDLYVIVETVIDLLGTLALQLLHELG